jgi:hypothetical protein
MALGLLIRLCRLHCFELLALRLANGDQRADARDLAGEQVGHAPRSGRDDASGQADEADRDEPGNAAVGKRLAKRRFKDIAHLP